MEIPPQLDANLAALDASARRLRTLLYIILTVTVLTLMAAWDLKSVSEVRLKISVAGDAKEIFPIDDKDEQELPDDRRREAAQYFLEKNEQLQSLEDLDEYLTTLKKRVPIDDVEAGIPILGARIPTRDAAVLGGLVFFSLMVLFGFLMARNHYALRETFACLGTSRLTQQFLPSIYIQHPLLFPPQQEMQSWRIWSSMPYLALWLAPSSHLLFSAIYLSTPESLSGPASWSQLPVVAVISLLTIFVTIFSTLVLRRDRELLDSAEKTLDQAEEDLRGSLGRWDYFVEDKDNNYFHSGYCNIEVNADGLQISGVRQKIGTSKDDAKEVSDAWKSHWVYLSKDNWLNFKYSIPLNEGHLFGLCEVNFKPDDASMEGSYSQLPPAPGGGALLKGVIHLSKQSISGESA